MEVDLFDQENPNFTFDCFHHDDADINNFDEPKKKMKLNISGEPIPGHLSSTPIQISFGKPDSILPAPVLTTKPQNSSDQRILSERKRREKLSESFISLSALIPDLKKMDKGSIMEDAIKYLKRLKDNIKSLEDKIAEGSHLEDEDEEEEDNIIGIRDKKQNVPNIKAIMSGKSILIQIHCHRIMGLEAKLLYEITRLRLTLVSSNFMQFGHNHTEITLVTEMKLDFNLTMEDLVKILQFNIFQS